MAQPSGLSQAHKQSWLLLQVDPDMFFDKEDCFYFLTCRIHGSLSPDMLLTQVKSELGQVKAYLGYDTTLFCVINKLQIPARLYTTNFLSTEGHPRSIIRELVRIWRTILPHTILSRTGLSIKVLESILRSVVAKEGALLPITLKDIGAFDSKEQLQLYLEQYLPPRFLLAESGKRLVTRAGF
jgi:hypothetical protein